MQTWKCSVGNCSLNPMLRERLFEEGATCVAGGLVANCGVGESNTCVCTTTGLSRAERDDFAQLFISDD